MAKKQVEYMLNPKGVSSTWFNVLNNPREHGFDGTEEEILQQLADLWVTPEYPNRNFGATYCISAEGLHHVHFVTCVDGVEQEAVRFSAIKKLYPQSHIEATKGLKKEVLGYLEKEGKYSEKGEIIIARLYIGEIFGREKEEARKVTLTEEVEDYLTQGMNPREIYSMGIKYLRMKNLIREMYTLNMVNRLGTKKDIKVYWHTSKASGDGKSYTYHKLAEENPGQVYLASDWSNHGMNAFDSYENERIIFMDELKPDSIPFGTLLTILDERISYVHARYFNILSTWEEVHITSIYTPKAFYEACIDSFSRTSEPYKQLQRRITEVVFHSKYEFANNTYYMIQSYSAELFDQLGLETIKTIATVEQQGAIEKMKAEILANTKAEFEKELEASREYCELLTYLYEEFINYENEELIYE